MREDVIFQKTLCCGGEQPLFFRDVVAYYKTLCWRGEQSPLFREDVAYQIMQKILTPIHNPMARVNAMH
jgi:hypothetical protein